MRKYSNISANMEMRTPKILGRYAFMLKVGLFPMIGLPYL